MNNYYVYEYIRLDTNEVFYVGKGKGNRAYSMNNRNSYFKNIIKSIPYEVKIVLDNLPEADAFEAEMSFIAYRKSIGQAKANLTLGGEGISGLKHSKQTKDKMSKSMVGNINGKYNKGIKHSQENIDKNRITHLGKTHSKEHKAKIGLSLLGHFTSIKTREKIGRSNSKQVIDITTGFVWESTKEASEVYGLKRGNLIQMLNNRRKNKTNLRYLDEVCFE